MNVPISFEFFPPKTPEGAEKLTATVAALGRFAPEFFSVTFGAGGSTRDGTLETVLNIEKSGYPAAPHLSCIASTRKELLALLGRYRENGVSRIVTLRGDLPSGTAVAGELSYASDLIALIRENFGDAFHLEVACYPEVHPQARTAQADFDHFVAKVAAGANSAITQYFYNADAYFRFVDEACRRGVTIPIVPGIMPIGNVPQLLRFSDMCGAEIPRWLRLRLTGLGEDAASARALGLDVVTDLCEQLLDGGAPGLHFYTLNQAALSSEICTRLGYGKN